MYLGLLGFELRIDLLEFGIHACGLESVITSIHYLVLGESHHRLTGCHDHLLVGSLFALEG